MTTSDPDRAVALVLRRRMILPAIAVWLGSGLFITVAIYGTLIAAWKVSDLFGLLVFVEAVGGIIWLIVLGAYFIHGIITGTLGEK